jgi:predicted Rossmann-fold nucleotide-binding protein
MIVVSGGYTGIMDGISKGVSEVNGVSVGITTDDITKVSPSKYLTQEFREDCLTSRLELMQSLADFYLFLPGSTGTLTELALVWDKQKLGLLPLNKILLFGRLWEKIFELMFKSNHDVQLSKWKLSKEVEENTIVIRTIKDLKDWISNYL